MKALRARPVTVHGKPKWGVLVPKKLNGGRYGRPSFDTREEAEEYIRTVHSQVDEMGIRFASLPLEQKLQALKLLETLRAAGISLEEGIHRILEQTNTRTEGTIVMKVSEAVKEFIRDREQTNLNWRTMREYRSHTTRFCLTHGEAEISSITKTVLVDWLDKIGVKLRTRANYITTLRAFFSFLVHQEYLEKNPAMKVPKPQSIPKEPEILTLEQVHSFIYLIESQEKRLLAPVVLSLFGGIRICELIKLSWKDISLTRRTITITDNTKKGKTRHRIIKIEDTLYIWLLHCHKVDGPVMEFTSEDNYQDVRHKIALRAGILKWPQNAMRHSFASYTAALDNDVKALSKKMGNSEYVVERHYKAHVEEEDGLKYFQTKPKQNHKSKDTT